ncbi:MAG: recombination mediator protein UvsY [Candidatus Peribacteraceae bacterium]|nr:recombination mediator protein UvsY [Candidatus Peribacteraceae bacterium]
MSDFQEYVDQAEIDLKIDSNDLDGSAITTPLIYVRYQNKLAKETRKLNGLLQKKAKLDKKRWRYYLGKGSAEDYKKEPFNDTVLKTDADKYLKADPLIQEMDTLLNEQRLIVKFLENCCSQITQRSFLIREAVAYRKLQFGDA